MRGSLFLAPGFVALLTGCATVPDQCMTTLDAFNSLRAQISNSDLSEIEALAYAKELQCTEPDVNARLEALSKKKGVIQEPVLQQLYTWADKEVIYKWADQYALNTNSASVAHALARHYEKSEKNHAMSAAWYAHAVERGDYASAHDLAYAFLHGWGGQKDKWKAYYWYHYAANKGYEPSQKACALLEKDLQSENGQVQNLCSYYEDNK